MKKLKPKGIIALSTTAFLFLILISIIYLNNQVEFNTVEAKWQLGDQYTIRPTTVSQQNIDTYDYSLLFNTSNDYVEFPLLTTVTDNYEVEIIVEFNSLPTTSDDPVFIFSNGSQNDGFHLFLVNNYPPAFNKFTFLYPTNNFFHSTTHDIYINNIYKINFGSINGVEFIEINDINQNLANLGPSYQYPDPPTTTTRLNDLSRGDFIIYELNLFVNNTSVHHYLFDEGTGNILYDNVGNKNGIIYGSTWLQEVIGSEIVNITIPGIDSYQVFENIRNNATTVNPLGFMNTLVSIPSQAVGYFKSFMTFLSFDIADGIQTWWRDKLLGPESGYWSLVEIIQEYRIGD